MPTRLPSNSAPRAMLLAAGLLAALAAPHAAARQTPGAPAATAAAPGAPRPAAVVDAAKLTNQQLLTDFVHYVKIDQRDLAEAFGRALLERALSPIEFVGLIEDSPQGESRFDEAVRDAMRNPALEDIASKLFSLREQGRRDRARDPDEITRNIALLGDNQRARLLARTRLAFAGEFIAPQLLEAIGNGKAPIVQSEAQDLAVAMGADAALPFSVALLSVDPAMQERLARLLGRMGQPVALPYLLETHGATASDAVRAAVAKAVAELDSNRLPTDPAPELYVALGEEFYNEPANLTRLHGEPHQMLWAFEPGVGLYATPIRTEVYHEAMAMGLAEHALRLDPATAGAPALWLAANFSRQLDTPEGYENPAYPAARRDAMYYAVAAGAPAAQRILARALRDYDTPLARLAIDSLARTSGAQNLWTESEDSSALESALLYPDRRVQFEAAMVLAQAHPQSSFNGSDRVVPILAAAIRDAGARFALILATEVQRQQDLQRMLQSMGFRALAPASSIEAAADAIGETPGVDVIVSDLITTRTVEAIDAARTHARLGAAPMLALLPASGYTDLFARFERDPLTRILRAGVADAEVATAVDRLLERAAGPALSEDQSRAYSLAALSALRDIAISGSPVYSIADAQRPLLAALETTKGQVRLDVADVLARIDTDEAQVALMDAALASSGEERLALFIRVGDSAKRFGSRLAQRQTDRLVGMLETASGDEAIGVASLVGALNLPASTLVPLIVAEPAPAN